MARRSRDPLKTVPTKHLDDFDPSDRRSLLLAYLVAQGMGKGEAGNEAVSLLGESSRVAGTYTTDYHRAEAQRWVETRFAVERFFPAVVAELRARIHRKWEQLESAL